MAESVDDGIVKPVVFHAQSTYWFDHGQLECIRQRRVDNHNTIWSDLEDFAVLSINLQEAILAVSRLKQ